MSYSRGVKIEDEISDEIIRRATDIASGCGVGSLSVKRIITELGITNRVFYNRFKNINEVLQCIYKNVVASMRQSITVEYSPDKDYYEFLTDIAVSILKKTYTNKLHFSQYMFDYDSMNSENRNWWLGRMKTILQYGMDNGYLKKTDLHLLSNALWCFCHGYNASSVGNSLSLDEVVSSFKLGFESMIEGLKPQS